MGTVKEKYLRSLPSDGDLADGLEQINKMLGVEDDASGQIADFRECYFPQPLDPNEIQGRIALRIQEQDEVIIPRREKEGRLTPEWKKYLERKPDRQ